MEPEVVTTFHIYPVGCEDLCRYTIVSKFTDPDLQGFDGITIQTEERDSEDKSFTVKWLLSLDMDEAKTFYNCLGKVIVSKEALVQVEASEAA